MKKINTLLFFILSITSFGQVNLVPNPSFEDTIECIGPFDETVKNWQTFKGSPDYFSPYCSPSIITDFLGKEPHTGDAYAGFITYGVNNPLNGREFLGSELISPLIVGEKYFVSFFLSAGLTNGSYNLATNNSGIMFSTYSYYDPYMEILNPNFSHIKTNEIISDTENWVKVSGSFVADSAYTYIIIGNFYDDIYTDTLHLPSTIIPHRAYCLVDDICVTTDSLYNEVWTGLTTHVKETDNIKLNCFPNPVMDILNIKAGLPVNSIEIISNLGQSVLFMDNLNENSLIIPVNKCKSGIYILKVGFSNNQSQFIKIVIK